MNPHTWKLTVLISPFPPKRENLYLLLCPTAPESMKHQIQLPWKAENYERLVNCFIHSVYACPTPEQMRSLFDWARDWARANCLDWNCSKEEKKLITKLLEEKVKDLKPDDTVWILWTTVYAKQVRLVGGETGRFGRRVTSSRREVVVLVVVVFNVAWMGYRAFESC